MDTNDHGRRLARRIGARLAGQLQHVIEPQRLDLGGRLHARELLAHVDRHDRIGQQDQRAVRRLQSRNDVGIHLVDGVGDALGGDRLHGVAIGIDAGGRPAGGPDAGCAGDEVQRLADVGLLRGKPAPERQHAIGVVHAVGDDRGVRLARTELLPYRGVLAGKLGVQDDIERNIQLLKQAADARDAAVDRVLAKCLVHEVGVAIRQIRTQHRALAESELFHEQREADGDFSAGGPGGNMHRLARERGDPVRAVLRQTRGGKASEEQRRRRTADE